MTTGFVQNRPKTVAPLASPNLASFMLTLGSLWIKSKDRLLLCALFMSVGREKAFLWILLLSAFSIKSSRCHWRSLWAPPSWPWTAQPCPPPLSAIYFLKTQRSHSQLTNTWIASPPQHKCSLWHRASSFPHTARPLWALIAGTVTGHPSWRLHSLSKFLLFLTSVNKM